MCIEFVHPNLRRGTNIATLLSQLVHDVTLNLSLFHITWQLPLQGKILMIPILLGYEGKM